MSDHGRTPARFRADQKLFFSYLAVIAAVVAVLTLGVGNTLRARLTEMVAADVRHEIALALPLAASRPNLSPDSLADWLGERSGRRVTLIDRDGRVLGDSDVDVADLGRLENHASRPEVAAALRGQWGEDVHLSRSLGTEQLYVAAPAPGGRVLRIAVPLADVRSAVRRVQAGMFGVGVVALVLTGLLSLAFSIAVTHPLRQMAAAAREMAQGDLTRRVRRRHRDELGELGDALDTLAAELQKRLGQLEGERAEMQALIDAMAEAVVAVDAGGSVRRANPAARRIFSLPADPRGMSPEEVARRPGFLALVRRAVAGEPVPPTEMTDAGRALLGTAHPLPGGGAVLVFLDVSELRRLEDVRRDFVANASHELKTPLTAIRGFSETLMDEALPAALRLQFARTVNENAERLQRIVDDLLDLSRLESGGWRPHPEIVSLAEAAAEAWEGCTAGVPPRGASFTVDVPPECEFVHADPSALRQVLANLIGNALRYIPQDGHVTVRARPAAAPAPSPARATTPAPTSVPAAGGWVAVEVRDDGAGIPAAHLPRIFERFYRADAARSRAEGGTGLGLSIVRHLVERHGGSVEAESVLGQGTTIRFTLPVPDDADGDGGTDIGETDAGAGDRA